MDENCNINTDLEAVIEGIKRLGSKVRGFGSVDPAWARPLAVLVIDCVLSLNRRYDTFVVPRLEQFMEQHPDIISVNDLRDLIAKYPTPHDFMQQELNFNYEARANTLWEIVNFLFQIKRKSSHLHEDEALKQWAIKAIPEDYHALNITGFGIAGFQYLRMLFGADTSKPDIHIIRFVSNLINRIVSPIEALKLLEVSSAKLELSVRDVDTYIWEISARPQQEVVDASTHYTSNTKYRDFWRPILEGKYGQLFVGDPVSQNDDGWMGKTIYDIELWLRLTSRKCYIRLFFLGVDCIENRDKLTPLIQDFDYIYKDTERIKTIIFPVLDKGKNDREDWDEIREKLVAMGTDIYNIIDESGL